MCELLLANPSNCRLQVAPLVHSFTGSLPEVLLQTCRAEKLEAGAEVMRFTWSVSGVRLLNGEDVLCLACEVTGPVSSALHALPLHLSSAAPGWRWTWFAWLSCWQRAFSTTLSGHAVSRQGQGLFVAFPEAEECLQLQRASSEMRFALEEATATERPP